MTEVVSLGLERPTLDEIQFRADAEINARLPGGDSRLRWNNLAVLSWLIAGAAHEMYGFLDGVATQAMPDKATGPNLDRHAAWRGIARKPPVAAAGTIRVEGTPGAGLPAGARLLRADRVEFVTVAPVLLDGTSREVAVRAALPGRIEPSCAGAPLSFVNAFSGIQPTARVVGTGLSRGADQEDDEALRARLRAREQYGPPTGRLQDYVTWALEVEGVTRAWARSSSACMVQLLFATDASGSDGIPDQDAVERVRAHIEQNRPAGAFVNVRAPEPRPIDVTIQALRPDTPAVKGAIREELRDMLLRDGAPGEPVLLSHVREAISIAAGEYDHRPIEPTADVVLGLNELPVLGTVAWL